MHDKSVKKYGISTKFALTALMVASMVAANESPMQVYIK